MATCENFEQNDEEQLTIYDLIDKMQEYLHNSDEDAYDRVFMNLKLKKHFGDRLLLSLGQGKATSNILTRRESADEIL